MEEEDDYLPFEEVVDHIDAKYEDGIAYISIHTIDRMNSTIATVVDQMNEQGVVDFSDETYNAIVWVMTMWQQLHDIMDLEAAKRSIPDTPEALFTDDE